MIYGTPPSNEGEAVLPPHRRLQIEFLDSSQQWVAGSALLDVGCAGGFFLEHAMKRGLDATGIEFNAETATLQGAATGLDIVSWDELRDRNRRYDVIHLGHVLEHSPDPLGLVELTSGFAKNGALWLVDGPLENQPCLSRFVVDLGSRARRRECKEREPQHVSCATATGQKLFFERLRFKTLRFEVRERAWPLPDRVETLSPEHLFKFALGRASVALSSLLPRLGNLFHFAGRRE